MPLTQTPQLILCCRQSVSYGQMTSSATIVLQHLLSNWCNCIKLSGCGWWKGAGPEQISPYKELIHRHMNCMGNKDHMGPPKWSTLKKTIKQPTQFSKHYNNIPLLDDARAHIKDVSVDIPFCQQNIILHMTRPGTFCSMRALPTNMHHPHHAYREVYSVHYHF